MYKRGCLQTDTHFQHFSRSTVAPIGRKKSARTFLLPKKKETFGGKLRLGRPSRQRRAPRAPWGLPTLDVGSTLGQPWVNVGSTFGQPTVSSLAIAGRFSLILPDSSIKTEDRRTCISQMVDFPIGKRDFRVRTWSGAFWEPLERKKEKTKCIYKICIPLLRCKLKFAVFLAILFGILGG